MRQAYGEAIAHVEGVSIDGGDGFLGSNGARSKQKE